MTSISIDYKDVASVVVGKIVERLKLGQLQWGTLNIALHADDDELVAEFSLDISMDGHCKVLDHGPLVELRGQYPFIASVTDAAGNNLELTITARSEQ
jgi:hypothetical protein